ncbi:MAG: hypothetical protein GF372_02945, partial [Candidatus Marinimicrobia bacterium]|nr:hypothetical protein [Candidatus Neomarinimicrobiota bacterium]
MKRIFRNLFLLTVFLIGTHAIYAGEPFLSNLSVEADDPLYTTYAAQMERSEFTLDQGYHLQFYKPEEGLKLTTDTAGDWLTGFKLGDEFVYKIEDMAKPPQVTLSYTDMVQYTYFPFEDIQVEATFLVYSSHFAIQELQISNKRDTEIELEIYSILDNSYRIFEQIEIMSGGDAVSFFHEELPDTWVLSHGVPYVDNVKNIFLVSEESPQITTYESFGNENINLPRQVTLSTPAKYLVEGRVLHSDGSRCRHPFPESEISVFINNDRDHILNHSSPKYGTSRANITGYGSYSIDLGSFP